MTLLVGHLFFHLLYSKLSEHGCDYICISKQVLDAREHNLCINGNSFPDTKIAHYYPIILKNERSKNCLYFIYDKWAEIHNGESKGREKTRINS